jgi:hypothetical protein
MVVIVPLVPGPRLHVCDCEKLDLRFPDWLVVMARADFTPRGGLVTSGCMLAQKIALENCEEEVLRRAIWF